MDFNHFIVDKQASTLHVTLNRPEKRNALNLAALKELRTIFNSYADDRELKIVVLTGTGDKSFAAGGDLKEFQNIKSQAETRSMSQLGFEALWAIKQFPVPVIAALNGVALGGGAELAVACDFRIAAKHARIGFIQSQLGIASAWGGAIFLADIVGQQRALRMTVRGEILAAEEALNYRLVDDVCHADHSLNTTTSHFIQPMLATSRQSLMAAKALRVEPIRLQIEQLRPHELKHFEQCWTSDEHWHLLDLARNQ
jgi:enoyl-CoA hydratase